MQQKLMRELEMRMKGQYEETVVCLKKQLETALQVNDNSDKHWVSELHVIAQQQVS